MVVVTAPDVFPATTENTAGTFLAAARVFWPAHADAIYTAFDELNETVFHNEIVNEGIVVGLTPHGKSLGYCEPPGRITLHPSLLTPASGNPWGIPADQLHISFMRDVLLHEMVHALLQQRRDDARHNGAPWCREVERISPLIGLGPVVAAQWKRTRIPKADGGGLTYEPDKPGAIPRASLASWPHALRPAGFYARTCSAQLHRTEEER